MFFGRANLGMRKAMNCLAAAPLSFNFPDTVMYNFTVRDQKCEVYIQQKIAAD